MQVTHTVILTYDGITRHYPCVNYFDALVIKDALDRSYGAHCVELWRGATKLS